MKGISAKLKRQHFVDDSIYELIIEINPTQKGIAWDIEFIGEVRDVIGKWFERLNVCSEDKFYPMEEEGYHG